MKTICSGKLAIIAAILAFFCISGSSFAADNSQTDQNKFNQGTKGHALQGLETTAGKKIQDVKVPEPPKPTPATDKQAK